MESILLNTFLRYLVISLVVYLLYLTYITFLKPLLFWCKYKKYKNVHVNPYFIPLLGDLYYHVKDMNAGKVHYHHKIEQASETRKYDLKVKLEGLNPILLVESDKALEQFVALQPHIIDRAIEYKGLTKAVPDGFINARTSKKTHERRKIFTALLNLNHASKYIPGMIDACHDLLSSLKDGEKHDFLHQMNCITFNILTNVLFGDDVNELKTDRRPFLMNNGQWEDKAFYEAFLMIANNFLFQLINPITTMFPFINNHDLINPYKRDRKNLNNFNKLLKEVIAKSKDEKSVAFQVFKQSKCTKQEIYEDLITYMVAGSETSARTMVSTLYFLKRHPEFLQKVKDELKENGLTKDTDFKKVLTMDVVQNLEYLTCAVKEALRMDSPTFESFIYKNYEDVEICDVPIPKGTIFKIDICSGHFIEDMWLNPNEYNPDRFFPDTEFYNKQKEKCPLNSTYSRRAFSQGKRACPGQTLAYLEIKIILAYIITMTEYNVDEEFLHRTGVGFGLGSTITPMFEIHKN